MNSDLIEGVHVTSPALPVTLQVLEHSDADTLIVSSLSTGRCLLPHPCICKLREWSLWGFFVLEGENCTWVLCAKPRLVESRSRASWIQQCDAYGGKKQNPNPQKTHKRINTLRKVFLWHICDLSRGPQQPWKCVCPGAAFCPHAFLEPAVRLDVQLQVMVWLVTH